MAYTEATKRYRKANRPSIRKQERRWEAENPWRQIFKTARLRAKREGVPFTITYNDVPNYYECVCPVFGIKLERHNRPWCPSLERVVSSKGYVPGNVIVVSYFVNRCKNDATVDQLIKIADFYKQFKETSNE